MRRSGRASAKPVSPARPCSRGSARRPRRWLSIERSRRGNEDGWLPSLLLHSQRRDMGNRRADDAGQLVQTAGRLDLGERGCGDGLSRAQEAVPLAVPEIASRQHAEQLFLVFLDRGAGQTGRQLRGHLGGGDLLGARRPGLGDGGRLLAAGGGKRRSRRQLLMRSLIQVRACLWVSIGVFFHDFLLRGWSAVPTRAPTPLR